ncbi:MAG: Gldg family protein, partial [Acetobacterales bacterium]
TGNAQPPFNSGTRPWVIWNQMNQFFEVRELLSNTDRIDPEVDVLMVVHPKNLSEDALYAIDQYVMGGGKAVFMVDPHAEAERIRPNPDAVQTPRTKSDLERLFAPWGFDVTTDQFVGDLRGAFRVQAGPNERLNAVDYVAWIGLEKDRLNSEDVVTGDLQRINVAAAGAIQPREGADIEITPLIRSSADSMLIDADKIRVMEPNPTRLLADFTPGGEERILAARITGQLDSAFPDGPPAPPAPTEGGDEKSDAEKQAEQQDKEAYEQRKAAHRAGSDGPVTMMVVGDVDLLEDRFWVRVQDFFGEQMPVPVADNGAFIINALEHLAGSADLISLRSRREGDRPFEVVQRMRQNAELRYRATERELQERLEDAEAKLAELRREGVSGQGGAIMTQQQQAEIEKFRTDVIDIRRQLRNVQLALREEIESLGTMVKFLNIGLVPLLVLVIALVTMVLRMRRRRPIVQG